jgi:vacuolar protein sorting-associated protein 13A/C
MNCNFSFTVFIFRLDLKLRELSVQGVKQGQILPIMVYSQLDSSDTLLEVMFETNPVDKKCDQRVVLGSRPLQIVYDAQTIIQLAKVFQTPKSATISQLVAAIKVILLKPSINYPTFYL